MSRELFARIRRFPVAEEGQSALFAAFTIFCLFVTVGVLIGVGEVTTTQMRVQNAADAAAYSGAAVEADCLAQIAWINAGMAEVYYHSLLAAADNVAASTHYMLARAPANPFWHPDRVANGAGGFLPSPAGFTEGFPDASAARATFQASYKRAQDLNNPDSGAAVEWLGRLGLIQRSIAIVAPDLVKHQIYHAAHVNFYEDADHDRRNDQTARVALFPADFSFYPEDMYRHDVVIEKLGNGWRLTSTTDPGYEFIAIHTSSSEKINEWTFILRYPDGDGTVEKRFTYREEIYSPPVPSGCDGKCKEKHNRKAAHYELKCASDGYELLITVYDDDADGEPDAVRYDQKMKNKSEQICLEPLDDGVIINREPYQWGPDGYLTKNGKRVNQTTTVEVNGIQVPVSIPTWLGTIKLGSHPIEFVVDHMHCVLNDTTMDIHVRLFPAGPVHIVNDEDVEVHWLHIKNCDGRWRDRDLYQEGKHFHRMKVVTAGEKWLYETITIGSYLTDMNWRKLFTVGALSNADLDVGFDYVPTGPGMPGGDPVDSDHEDKGDDDDTVWEKKAAAPWTEYPEWARPPRVPLDNSPQQLNFGGFMSIDAARPVAYGETPVDYAFSATCPARYPCPSNRFTNLVPPGLKKMLPRKVYFPRFAGNTVILSGESVNPLFLMYFPKEWEARVQNDVDAKAMGIPDYINNDGNLYPGYWIEGGFRRETEQSQEGSQEGEVTLEERIRQYRAGFAGQEWALDPESPATRVPFPCAAFERASAEGKLWYLVVFDPLGAVPIFRQEPRYYGQEVAFYNRNSQLPDRADDYEVIAKAPAMVRRSLGPRLNGVRLGSVKEFLMGNGYLDPELKGDWLAPAGMALNLDDFDRGLEATSELFRRPLVVGVHAPPTFGWLAGLFGRDRAKMGKKARDMGLGNPLYVIGDGSGPAGSKWTAGHFAFAAARVFFEDGSWWATSFRYGNAGSKYASSFADSFNIIKQPLPGAGQRWQKSPRNFFNPVWTAALVPFNAAVRLRDLYSDFNDADFNTKDSPAAFLLRQMVRVDWRRNMANYGFGNMARDARVSVHKITAPPRQGHNKSLNLDGDGIEHVFLH